MPHRRRRRPRPEWSRIREVFLEPRASYSTAELPALLGIAPAAVRQAIEEGTITAIPVGRELRIVWEDVVALALEHRWTFRMLTEALRGCDRTALPPPVRVVTARVALPRYQWQLLRLLAARRTHAEHRQITVSDLLEEAITTTFLMQIENGDPLETSLPGLHAATAWPAAE